jgi:purine nucleosidase
MRRIVIDCDPGIDDAEAIMMAYMHPEVKIEAITTVAGNVGAALTAVNALKILDVLDAEPIPVFPGAAAPLVEAGADAAQVHGEDGLGGCGIPDSDRELAEEHAAKALIRLAMENPGELELIAIGPLTNLALALHLDPDLPTRFKRLVIMGGAIYAQGNTTNFPAEFNIFADPDAAAVVFATWPEFTMVSWEATMAHGMPLDQFKELLSYDNKRSQFLKKVTKTTLAFLKEVLNREMSYAADPLAMAVLMEPEIVKKSEKKYVQVETHGTLTRGMTVIDWWGLSKQKPNVDIVLEVDLDRFTELLRMAVK